MTFDDFIRQCAEDCVNADTSETKRDASYAEAAQDPVFMAEMAGVDDRPVAGFADANDQPALQAAIRAQERHLAELRTPSGQRRAERDGGPRPRRVVFDACHYRNLQNLIRGLLAFRVDAPDRIPDYVLAQRGVGLASYLSSSFDLDIFGNDLPTLDSYHCIECGKRSDSRLCAACYVESKS